MIMIEGGLGRRGWKRLLANGHVAATSTGIASKSQILSVHHKGEKIFELSKRRARNVSAFLKNSPSLHTVCFILVISAHETQA